MNQDTRYEPYHIIQRKTRKGKKVFYVRFLDQKTGRTLTERSSGQTSRSAAVRWAEAEMEKIRDRSESAGTVESLADGFWDWDAPYARGRRARGKPISHGTLDVAESNTRNHIIPRWGSTHVSDITAAEIDTWILSLEEEKGLSAATVNKLLQTMRTLLDGAVGRGWLRYNPAKAVEPLSVRHEERGVLTDEEIRALLRWPGPFRDYRVYTMNLLAFCTGLRIGEARGLMVGDVHNDHIVIRHSWEEGYGIKPPKNGRSRAVPVPEQAKEALQKVIADFEPESLVFYGRTSSTPLSKSYVLNGLRDAIVTMKLEGDPEVDGMSDQELAERRKQILQKTAKRRIGFHSWRHKLNTMLRAAGVPDAKIRLLTGHRTPDMTDWYTKFLETDMEDVTAAQTKLLGVGSKRSPKEKETEE